MSGFSLWCDFVERDFLKDSFSKLISAGINGATSNPSIFKDAILNSKAYKENLAKFKNKSKKELYEILATYDIKLAANTLLLNYATQNDGFISIEVDPNLTSAKDIVKEGKRLFNAIKMPNVMIKIPAVKFGYEAMSELIKQGINVNATLIFTKSQAKKCLDAFEEGFREFDKKFQGLRAPSAVISIFVSRFDRALESKLKDTKFANKVGIMNASKIYKFIEKRAVKNTRALFASTGVKGNDLAIDYYLRELLYPNSINTAPLVSIEEFSKQPQQFKAVPSDEEIKLFFDELKEAGVDMKILSLDLLNDGLKAFCTAFDEILSNLEYGE